MCTLTVVSLGYRRQRNPCMAGSRKFQQPRLSRRQLLLLAALATACYFLSVRVLGRDFASVEYSGGTSTSRRPFPTVSVDLTAKGLKLNQNVFTKPGPPGSGFRRQPTYCARRKHNSTDASVAPNDKVAILVDGSDSIELIPVVSQFLALLPGWKFVIFHSDTNAQKLNSSTILWRWTAVGQLRLARVPDEFSLDSEAGISHLFRNPWLWAQFPEEHVLVFRTDSMLCSSSTRNIDDYLHYDFIGAPHVENGRLVYDGGLSIRRRSKMLAALRLLQEHRRNVTLPSATISLGDVDTASPVPSSAAELHAQPDREAEGVARTSQRAARTSATSSVADGDERREDRWFSDVLADMPGNCLPSPETAAEFSVGREWFEESMGARALWVWHPRAIVRHFQMRCPDFNLVYGGTLS